MSFVWEFNVAEIMGTKPICIYYSSDSDPPKVTPISVSLFGKFEMTSNSMLSHSLQFPQFPTFAPFSSSSLPNYRSNQLRFPQLAPLTRPRIRISCISTRPNRKSSATSNKSEGQKLVRLLLRKFSDKEPLLNTLNKYVRLVRTEHCFLLFEELGNDDKWLQCLEVGFLLRNPPSSIWRNISY